jgi:UDP-N-acetyl-D-glucosamine dehydrogenase
MEPDLSYLVETTKTISKNLRRGQLIVLESTTYPGTTEEMMLPRLQTGRLKVGEDFFLAFSPEREDPGNRQFNSGNIPKVVGGVTPACLEVAAALYDSITQSVPVSSTRAAELTKLLENTYRSVNIALVNELKVLAHKMDIDLFEVINAAATKPFGYTPFYPGPGLGGALHSYRSFLSGLEGPRIRFFRAIYSSGRRDQCLHALLCHRTNRGGLEPGQKKPQWQQNSYPWHCL